MESKEGKKSINVALICIIVILLIALVLIVYYFVEREKDLNKRLDSMQNNIAALSQNTESSLNTIENPQIESSEKSNVNSLIRIFSVKFVKELGRVKNYNLDNEFEIETEMVSPEPKMGQDPCLSFKVNNGEETFKDYLFFSDSENDEGNDFTFKFYRVGEYLVYVNHNATDIRSSYIYFINKSGNLVKEIHEFDPSASGLVADEVKFTENTIIVKASRLSHGPDVIYGEKVTSQLKNRLDEIPNNTIVEAEYTYKLESDGTIDLDNPKEKVISTYKDFLENNKDMLNTDSYYN